MAGPEGGGGGGKVEVSCRVCGDRASGRHYGVPSCDGCRGFFKRSVRRDLEYACKEQGRCPVDVARRNQCQACRLRKCLAVGMRREAVQHERASRSQPKRRPRLTGGSAEAPTPFPRHHPAFCADHPPRLIQVAPPAVAPVQYHHQHHHHHLRHEEELRTVNDLKATPPTEVQKSLPDESSDESGHPPPTSPAQPVGPLLQLAPPPPAWPPLEQPTFLPGPPLLDAAQESAARLLFLSVRWMRGVPSFLRLGFRDQAILLEESWSDVFVLSAAQWGFPLHEGFLSFASVTSPERRPLVACQLHQMKSVVSQLVSQHVDPTEYSCLKALALFRPEASGLRDPLQVEMFQDQTQLMLHEYVLTRQPPSKVRFGRLLLALSQVRRVSPAAIEEVFFRKTIGSVPIERLLCDMFQAA